jgi:hypothetical protein
MASQALGGDVDAARVSVEKLKSLAPGWSPDRLYRVFGRSVFLLPRLQEGMRLALALPDVTTNAASASSPPQAR